MSECKICGTGCQWVFCGDCEKLIGNGIDEYDRTIADLTAKLKLAVEAINLTRIGLEGEVHHSKDIKTSHHCREMLQRLDSCLAKIGEQR